jgi:hypothetical protein
MNRWLPTSFFSSLLFLITGAAFASTGTAENADRDLWHIEYVPKGRIAFTLFLSHQAPDANVSEYVAFAAKAPELAQQRQVHSSFSVNGAAFGCQTVSDVSSYRRPLLLARIPASTYAERTNITLSATHEVSLFVRRLARGANTNPPPVLSTAERTLALADSSSFGYKSPQFTAWLSRNDLDRRPDESAIAFGRRAHAFIAKHMTYESPYPGWNDPLDKACQLLTGDCGAYARLFVGIMRANGIPARCLVGFYIKPGEGRQEGGNHVKSEFFAEGVGWVPADTTLRKPENFGIEAGNFVTLHQYAEEPMAMPTPHWGVRKRGCLMVIELYRVANPAGHPQLKCWNVASQVR